MKLKKLAAALALVAAAPAFAAINQASTGNGEFVLVVLDRVDQVSYAVDLGLSLDPGSGLTQLNVAADLSPISLNGANFQAFLAAASTTNNALEFAVVGADSVGSTAAAPKRLFTTTNQPTTPLGNQVLTNSISNWDTFTGNQIVSATGQTHSTVANGDGWAALGNTSYFLNSAMDTFNGQTASGGWANTNVVGTNAVLRSFATSSTSGGAATVQSTFGVWSLSQDAAGGYSLSYSAVPEPGTISLLLAGLGVVGFISRRRQTN